MCAQCTPGRLRFILQWSARVHALKAALRFSAASQRKFPGLIAAARQFAPTTAAHCQTTAGMKRQTIRLVPTTEAETFPAVTMCGTDRLQKTGETMSGADLRTIRGADLEAIVAAIQRAVLHRIVSRW